MCGCYWTQPTEPVFQKPRRDRFGHDAVLIFSQQVLTNFHSNCVVLPMEIKCLFFLLIMQKRKIYILLHVSTLVDNLLLLALFNDNFRGYIDLCSWIWKNTVMWVERMMACNESQRMRTQYALSDIACEGHREATKNIQLD